MTQFRGFIAIDVKPFSKIIDFENEIKKTGCNIKLVEPENIHITLKFLGDTQETIINDIEKILKASTVEIKPFEIKLKGTGVFPNQNYIKVIWIGLKNTDPITKIVKNIDTPLSEIGFQREKREFSPHLTIARVKTAKNKESLIRVIENFDNIEFGDINVDTIKLKKSELTSKGPIYSTLKEIKL